MIYLDHNATTPIAPEVAEAMAPFMGQRFGNPSSGHAVGQDAKKALEEARTDMASLLHCRPEEVVFTSGGTESNNMVIHGLARKTSPKKRHIITTVIEHPAITNPCLYYMYEGWDVTFLPVDGSGMVDPDSVKKAIKPSTFLISVMHANNETGTIQPIREIGQIAQEAGVPFHTDAAQSVGKIPTDVSSLQVDFLSVAGHKVYAPKGVGALYVKDGVTLEPLMHGAGQEMGKRAGTENVMFAVGLGRACSLAGETMLKDNTRVKGLRDFLYDALVEAIAGLTLNGHLTERLPNTLNVSFPGIDGSRLLEAVPDICASTGAACHDQSVVLSHVLAAMNVPEHIGRGAVRITLGRHNTRSEIETAVSLFADAYKKISHDKS